MKPVFISFFLFAAVNTIIAQNNIRVYNDASEMLNDTDWLVTSLREKAEIFKSADGKNIILSNGLVRRTIRLFPNATCIDYKNMITGQQLLRSVSAEARLVIDGKEYNVGGLYGQKEKAYLLPEWVDGFMKNENDFQFEKYEIGNAVPFLKWKAGTWWTANKEFCRGKRITFFYHCSQVAVKDIQVKVIYEVYDGIPLICKWVELQNNGAIYIKLNRVVNEIIATVEEESAVVGKPSQMKTQQGIYI
ncbi:MAG TPA: hypothetical protein VG676_15830, partial [Chitinophagaceae bacterium]|nr:hypothetical protein [Chitinophagaceae bacterium]